MACHANPRPSSKKSPSIHPWPSCRYGCCDDGTAEPSSRDDSRRLCPGERCHPTAARGQRWPVGGFGDDESEPALAAVEGAQRRLHDCEWPLPDVVDMHAVFPRTDADPQDPASYQFPLTDAYLQAIVDTGASIVYRLGESIEHSKHKQFVHPPQDNDRWAAACLGIIRHYNEGWADGFHHDIRYWEIWNEPENRPAMWSGNDDDYYRLYGTAAKAIKSKFPDLQVGGPAVGATGEVVDGRLQATEFLTGLLDYCQQHRVPLDFLSWHTYTDDPYLYVRKAQAIRQWLDDHGFAHTKIHLNEWNYLPQNDWTPMLAEGIPEQRQAWFETIGGVEGAAFTACVLTYLQDSPVDVANYYNGDVNPFGLFNRYGVPRRNYYAMDAFQRLLATPQRVQASGWQAGRTAACAGIDSEGRRAGVLISNLRSEESSFVLEIDHLPWNESTAWTAYVLDAERNLERVASGVHAGRPSASAAGIARAPASC